MEEKNNFTVLKNLKKKECIDIIYKNIDEDTLKNWVFEENNHEEIIKKLIDRRFNKNEIKDFIMKKQYILEKKIKEEEKNNDNI